MSFLGISGDGWADLGIGAAAVGACFIPGVGVLGAAAIIGTGATIISAHRNHMQATEQRESQKDARNAQNAANRKTMSRQRQSIALQKNRAREAAAINSMAQGSAAKTNEHFAEVANRKAQSQVEMLSKTEHSRAQRYYGKSLH